MNSFDTLRLAHQARFGQTPAIYAAPGRVNLIGEHTDYAEGFVMPAAIDFATLAAVSPSPDNTLRLWSENFEELITLPADELPTEGHGHWSDYPLGVLNELRKAGITIPAFQISLWGDVPLGSGLSSSASIEVATATALLGFARATLPPAEVALLAQRAENLYVHSNCGIMDQFISVHGKADHALLLDCRDLSYRQAALPPHVSLVIANTMVKHSVAAGEYPVRRAQVEEAARLLEAWRAQNALSHAPIRALRDATIEDLEAAKSTMDPTIYKRARHVITENARTVAAADALEQGDLALLGTLMHEAHVSMSQDFEAGCAEADLMVDLARDLPGLIGARLTGGGFGGCTINLVSSTQAAHFAETLAHLYHEQTNIAAKIYLSHASDGARQIS